jgi:hypothetical protein
VLALAAKYEHGKERTEQRAAGTGEPTKLIVHHGTTPFSAKTLTNIGPSAIHNWGLKRHARRKAQRRPLATPSGIAINHFMSVIPWPVHLTKWVIPGIEVRCYLLGGFLETGYRLVLLRLPPIVDSLLAHRLADGLKIVDD